MTDHEKAHGRKGSSPEDDWPSEAELDQAYRGDPFPSFREWNQEIPVDESRRAAALGEEIQTAAEKKGAEALNRALMVTLRAAAVDTGAIEGLYETDEGITLSIARQSLGWEAVAQAREILPFFEAQLAALEIVMDLATQSKPIASGGVSQMALKELHREITRNQTHYPVNTPSGRQLQELPHGEYKHNPNHLPSSRAGRPFAFAPVLDTATEMQRFVEELSRDEFSVAHPLVKAAYAHYALVRIHPFADGNGRMARALASLYSIRAYKTPVVIFAEDRASYLRHLGSADLGKHAEFTQFIGWAVVSALELALDELLHGVTSVPEQAGRLNKLLRPDGEIDLLQADRASIILLELAAEALAGILKEAGPHFHLTSFQLARNVSGPGNLPGLREPLKAKSNGLSIVGTVEGPTVVKQAIQVLALVEKARENGAPARVALAGSETIFVEARRLIPADSQVRRLVKRWAERQFAALVEQLESKTKEALGSQGL